MAKIENIFPRCPLFKLDWYSDFQSLYSPIAAVWKRIYNARPQEEVIMLNNEQISCYRKNGYVKADV